VRGVRDWTSMRYPQLATGGAVRLLSRGAPLNFDPPIKIDLLLIIFALQIKID
jgi:hypothetical protein